MNNKTNRIGQNNQYGHVGQWKTGQNQDDQNMTKFLKEFSPSAIKLPIEISDLELADFDKNIYVDAGMKQLSKELLGSKSKYDQYYSGKNFVKIHQLMDIYSFLKEKYKSHGQQISNAWLKYYEIYVEFNQAIKKIIAKQQLKEKNVPFKVFFNAELPGSSLSAFNHFAYAQGIEYDWRASSLYDKDSTALGDKYGFYAKNKDKWLMNEKNNGDMKDKSKILEMSQRLIDEFGKVNLYSHDAGEYIGEEFATQEEQNFKLHLGCAIMGFITMAPGAMFIAKQYNFFRAMSYGAIAIYSTLFEKFYIYKPCTSRPGNSEIYLIGLGFKGIDTSTLNALFKIFEVNVDKIEYTKQGFFDCLPINITQIKKLGQIFEASQIIFGRQIKYTDMNMKYHDEYKEAKQDELSQLRKKLVQSYIKYQDALVNHLNVPILPRKYHILGK